MLKLVYRLALLFGGAGLLGGLGIGLGLRHGYVDAFYARFTAPPAGSLIVGTSRAAQGIAPALLAAKLSARYQGPWLNYAFTLAESPYGPGYLSSIRRKLAPGTQHGLFILAVDPWSLSLPKSLLDKSRLQLTRPKAVESFVFPEDKSMVSQLAKVSQNPNLDYLAHYLHKPFYQLLLDVDTTRVIERLHPDGWLEVALPAPAANPSLLRRRTADKLATYQELACNSQLASARISSLGATIEFLQRHGQVVLVRLPTGPAMAALEQQYQPDFDRQLGQIAGRWAIPYFNYLTQPYPTTDGNHLWRGAARSFSQRLAADIARLPAQP